MPGPEPAAEPHRETETSGKRTYIHPVSGDRYPSVTTIIKATAGAGGLVRWAATMAAEFAVDKRVAWLALDPETPAGRAAAVDLIRGAPDRYRDNAGDLGSAVHTVIDALVKDVPLPSMRDQVEQRVSHFLQWVEDYEVEFWMAELVVAHPKLRYAGTLDCGVTLGRCNGMRVLVDTKTGKNLYGAEVAMQLRAYQGDEDLELWLPNGVIDQMPEIDGLAALHISDDGYAFVRVDPDLSDDIWQAFQAARRLYGFQAAGRKSLVGKIRRVGDPHFIEDYPSLSRFRSVFAAIGLTTLEQLAPFTDQDLRGIDGIGPKAVLAVRAAITASNITPVEEGEPASEPFVDPQAPIQELEAVAV